MFELLLSQVACMWLAVQPPRTELTFFFLTARWEGKGAALVQKRTSSWAWGCPDAWTERHPVRAVGLGWE